jgi:hypothetical protein
MFRPLVPPEKKNTIVNSTLQKILRNFETVSTCSCCMETMALNYEGDAKTIKLSCSHGVCQGCAIRMVRTAILVPFQVVTCPYCRRFVPSTQVKEMCRSSVRLGIIYERIIMKAIPRLIQVEDFDVPKIQEKMRKSFFGYCFMCKDEIVEIVKECSQGLPDEKAFKCEKCTIAETLPGESNFDTKCPHCEAFIVRTNGCAFMTCLCGGCFCALCGTGLNQSHHYSHFFKNPFGNLCEGPDGNERVEVCKCRQCIKRNK